VLRGLSFGYSGSFWGHGVNDFDNFSNFGSSGNSGDSGESTSLIKRLIKTTRQAMTGLRSRLIIKKTMTGLN
jgi:hypothetical protein